jgi:hypothetical protein
LEDLEVDGRIILIWILKIKDGRIWAEIIWLRAKWQIFVNMVP